MNLGEKYKVQLSLSDFNDARILAFNFVNPATRVLDVGCACGDFGALLSNSKSCNVHGVDYDADSLKLAASTACYQHLEQADLNVYDIKRHPEWNSYFDCITFLDVLRATYLPAFPVSQWLYRIVSDWAFVLFTAAGQWRDCTSLPQRDSES